MRFYERLGRKWIESKRKNTFLESMRIGRFNLRRLSVALAPHPSPLPKERELVTWWRCPSPQPSPQGEGASNNGSAASVLWRGLWPPWQVSEKPLPVSHPFAWGGEEIAREVVSVRVTKTRVSKPLLQLGKHPLFITLVLPPATRRGVRHRRPGR